MMRKVSHGPNFVSESLVFYNDVANPRCYTSGTSSVDLISQSLCSFSGASFSSSNKGVIGFDGTDDYVNSYQIMGFTGGSPFSIFGWINCTSGSGGVQHIVGKEIINSPYTGYQIAFNCVTGSAPDNGKIGVVFVDSSVNIVRRQSTSTYNDGVWHSFCMTYDGSLTRAGMTLYVDGFSISVTDHDSSSFLATMNNASNFQCGARDGTSQPFNGKIGPIAVYSRLLLAEEVYQNHVALKSRFI